MWIVYELNLLTGRREMFAMFTDEGRACAEAHALNRSVGEGAKYCYFVQYTGVGQ